MQELEATGGAEQVTLEPNGSSIDNENDGPMHTTTDKPVQHNKSLSKRESVSIICKTDKMSRFLIYYLISAIVNIIFIVVIPGYGAQWYGGCDWDEKESDCDYNYSKYLFYHTLFDSIRGSLRFLLSGYIGRLSDAFGRKYFIIAVVILQALPPLILYISENFYIFFISYIFLGMVGGSNTDSPIYNAAIADIIPDKELKLIAYGIILTLTGVGVLIGGILAITITAIWSDYTPFLIISILYFLVLIYVIFLFPETLKDEDKKPLRRKNGINDSKDETETDNNTINDLNPFAPFFYILDNKIVFWLCMISLLSNFSSAGATATIYAYFADQLKLKSPSAVSQLSGMYAALLAIGMIIWNLFVIPYYQKKGKLDEIRLLFLTISSMLVSITLVSIVDITGPGTVSIIIIVISSASNSFGLSRFAASYSLISQHVSTKEQGKYFGLLFSVRSLTSAIAPFTFGIVYRNTTTKSFNFPSLMYVGTGFIIAMIIPMILGPLVKSVKEKQSKSDVDGVQLQDKKNSETSRDIKK